MTHAAPEHDDRATVLVEAVPGSDLANELARYADLKAQRDAAQDAYDACTDAIKNAGYAAGVAQDPMTRRIVVRDPAGLAPPLAITHSVSQRLDGRRLKADHPDFHAAYCKPTESWGMRTLETKADD